MLKTYIEKIFLLIGFGFIFSLSYAEEIDSSDMYVEKEFLIIYSTKNYNEALRVCKEADSKLKYGIDLRELQYNKKTGLTFSKESLGSEEDIFPWYFPRGRGDDGRYLSIEYSNGYKEFAKGYYIVIAESGEKGSMKESLKEVKRYYKDSYLKKAKIYIGCLH
jgi:hypothetical protein